MNYSHKDFTGRTLIEATDLDGQTITGTCFSQETPDSVIFPDKMTGVTFVNCNLDNVFIPEGNKTIDCSERRYAVQNDLHDWELDDNGEPIQLLNVLILEKLGIDPPTPDQIPAEPVESAIDYTDTARNVRVD